MSQVPRSYIPCPSGCTWSPGNPVYLEPQVYENDPLTWWECPECDSGWTPQGIRREHQAKYEDALDVYQEDTRTQDGWGTGGQGSTGESKERQVDTGELDRRARMEQADNARIGSGEITSYDRKTKYCNFKPDKATLALVPNGVTPKELEADLQNFFQETLDTLSSRC